MPATRLEHDSLGRVRVPRQAYYGAQTARALANFQISGLTLPRSMVIALVRVKQAAAAANAELRLLPKGHTRAIIRAGDEILRGRFADQFRVDVFQAGAGTSLNMNVNEVLANRANELLGRRRGTYQPIHPNDHVNMAQSTNDVIPTAIRLAALAHVRPLMQSLEALEQALLLKAREFMGVVRSARTHLQDAVPIRLGQDFHAWALMVRDARAHIREAARELEELNLGATAAGTGLNAHPRYRVLAIRQLRRATRLPLKPATDLVQITQDLGDFAHLSGALRNYALTLIKIANDLRLLTSGPTTGFNEIELPALQPGSSIMPGKVNPVIPEMVNMAAFHVVGNDVTIAMAVQAGQLELNVMMPVVAYNLLQSLEILTHTSATFAHQCIRGIRANVERCRRYAESSPSLVTALAPILGYEETAKVAQRAVREGKTVREVAIEQRLLSPQEARRLLNPARWTKPTRLQTS